MTSSKKEHMVIAALRDKLNNSYNNLIQSDPMVYYRRIIFVVVYVCVLFIQQTRYHWWYPTIPVYPNNIQEAQIVLNDYILKRMPSDVEFAILVDENPAVPFQSVIPETDMPLEEMKRIMVRPAPMALIMFYKYLYNRARPFQVIPDKINLENGTLLPLKNYKTPSYPSGHAYQAYYLASILCKQFPTKTKAIMDVAEKVANSRIIAGVHYPSDRDFAKQLVRLQRGDKLPI